MQNEAAKPKLFAVILGPSLALICYFLLQYTSLNPQGCAVLSLALWMSVWWVTEAIPMEVTALLPLMVFTLFADIPIKTIAAPYAHPLIFLFLGAYLIALAIEKTDLHKRMALKIIQFIGTQPSQLLTGFMLSTALLSMWMSNTATVVMMLPMAMAVIRLFPQNQPLFASSLLLGVAYSASIGGMATLIGTPPNLIFTAVLKEQVNLDISFMDWLVFAAPVSMLLWLITRSVLKRKLDPSMKDITLDFLALKGPITTAQKRVLLIFSITAIAWISRAPLIQVIVPKINDTHIALIGGILLFIVPMKKGVPTPILQWGDTVGLPWGTLILFGGGLSLAQAIDISGAAQWMGQLFQNHTTHWHPFWIILGVVIMVNFTTEITSNLATTAVMLPILIPFAQALDIPVFILLGGMTLSASCAFMLPVATAPNALAFGTGKIPSNKMIRTGLKLNLLSSIVISLVMYSWMIFSTTTT